MNIGIDEGGKVLALCHRCHESVWHLILCNGTLEGCPGVKCRKKTDSLHDDSKVSWLVSGSSTVNSSLFQGDVASPARIILIKKNGPDVNISCNFSKQTKACSTPLDRHGNRSMVGRWRMRKGA